MLRTISAHPRYPSHETKMDAGHLRQFAHEEKASALLPGLQFQ